MDQRKLHEDDYFTIGEHRFMSAAIEIMEECGWDKQDARDMALELLDHFNEY